MSGQGLLGGGGGDVNFSLNFVDFPTLPDCEELEEDELNEETFGTDLPVEEWDITDLSAQTAQISRETSMDIQSVQSRGLDYGNQADMLGQHQAWLEESISNLIDDDDDIPRGADIPLSHALPIPSVFKQPQLVTKELNQLFGVGSPQTPFFDIAIASSAAAIWGPPSETELRKPEVAATTMKEPDRKQEVNGREPEGKKMDEQEQALDIEFGSFTDVDVSASSDPQEVPPEPLRSLLAQMKVKEKEEKKTGGLPMQGAKTLEEIEAEMREPKILSLEELERRILGEEKKGEEESPLKVQSTEAQIAMQHHLLKLHQAHHAAQQSRVSPNTFLAAMAAGGVGPRAASPAPDVAAQPQKTPQFPPGFDPRMIPRFPAGHPMAGMPMLPPHLIPPPQPGPAAHAAQSPVQPPVPPALLMNPSFRAALAAHLAAGKPLPPGLSPAMVSMLFRSPLLAQRMPPPPGMTMPPRPGGQDPRQRLPFPRMPPPHPSSQQNSGGGKMMPRRVLEQQNGQSGTPRGGRETRDPFNGLMGRKEREWLMKIQAMQLQSDNPYQDDYYFTMLKNRQLAKERKETGLKDTEKEPVTHKDSGDNGTTPYVYVPPKFEGSLGKVQYVSANFPRQLIDLAKETSKESSPRDTPVGQSGSAATEESGGDVRRVPGATTLRQFKVLLIEVENLWTLLLDCEDHQRQLLAAPDDAKTGIQFAVKVRMGQITERLSGERLALIACIRKGKHLIARSLGLMEKEEVICVLQDMCTYMSQIVRKDMNEEALEIMFPAIFECMRRLGKQQMGSVVEKLSASAIKRAFAAKNKFVYCFTLLVVSQCARKKVQLPSDENVKSAVVEWATLVQDSVFPVPEWFRPDHVPVLCQWLSRELSLDENSLGKLEQKLKQKTIGAE